MSEIHKYEHREVKFSIAPSEGEFDIFIMTPFYFWATADSVEEGVRSARRMIDKYLEKTNKGN